MASVAVAAVEVVVVPPVAVVAVAVAAVVVVAVVNGIHLDSQWIVQLPSPPMVVIPPRQAQLGSCGENDTNANVSFLKGFYVYLAQRSNSDIVSKLI